MGARQADGEIGLGVTESRNASKYMQSQAAIGASARWQAWGVEIYYRDKLYRGISVEPDLQFVENPGYLVNASNSLIAGVRLDVNF